MAKFIMRQMAEGMGRGTEKMYPHLMTTGVTTLDDIATSISASSSFTPGDVKGLVTALAEEVARAVARGRSVQIDPLGSFRASLELERNVEAERTDSDTHRNATSVRIGGVLFRPAKELVTQANRAARLERIMPRKGEEKPEVLPLEARKEAARAHLAEHPWLTVSQYAALTHLSRTAAARELRELVAEPNAFLDFTGGGSHRVYILRSAEE